MSFARYLRICALPLLMAFGSTAQAEEDTIKIGILHSLSGTMAISETILKDLMLMEVADVNAHGGLLGKKIEPVVVDPASNWPLFAEKARELLIKDKVAAVFGCWTSVSRKSVLPVFEELNGLLFYPLEYEGEESSYNIFYGSSVPDNKAIPAVEYLMSKDGGEVRRFVLEGTDYVYPRTSNKIIRAFLKTKGVKDEDIMENYTPFGFSDWQTEVAAIKKFGTGGKKTAVISTINGDANVYKELGNQGVKATDIPVIAFSVGEEELAGLDTKPLVGHLAAWSYFQSVNTPENKAFIAKWREYTKNPKRVTNDPMESAYILFHMWVQAVQQAGSTSRRGAPGDDRAEGEVAIGLRSGDGSKPSYGEARDDRRDQGGRPVQHRLPEQGPAAEGLEPLCRSQQGKDCRLVMALGLRRLHFATVCVELNSDTTSVPRTSGDRTSCQRSAA
jgi:urea transport system substrate-binding protein